MTTTEPRGVVSPVELLEPYRNAGVLVASDVHTAAALARLCGVDDPAVILAIALAARAPRSGDVAVDLATIAARVHDELESSDVPLPAEAGALWWPDPAAWRQAVAASAVLEPPAAPLVLEGDLLYLDRYHADEVRVAAYLLERAAAPAEPLDIPDRVVDALLAGEGAEQQRSAVERALASRLTLLVGGPGTGKTTTVAALLAALVDARPDLRVGLAAPTGKAAARLTEAFHDAARRLPFDLAATLTEMQAGTVHRLLGARTGMRRTYGHDRRHPLPLDVVIVDETSMLSLPLTARLLDALAPSTRLVLVGDPAQLGSVEAGSVLADVARSTEPHLTACRAELEYSRRYPPGSPLDRLAVAVRAGDADATVAALESSRGATSDAGAVRWIDRPATDVADAIRPLVEPAAIAAAAHAAAGEAAQALDALARVRLLCAHRRGPFGVEQWNREVESWLHAAGVPTTGWYAGRPVMITANDHRLQLFNGDTGVVVVSDGRTVVAFAEASNVRLVSPAALEAVDTVHATTIHKSQGSEYDDVVVVVPPESSRLATRELLYTALTRARRSVTVVGPAAAVRAAVDRAAVRTSGLPARLR